MTLRAVTLDRHEGIMSEAATPAPANLEDGDLLVDDGATSNTPMPSFPSASLAAPIRCPRSA